MNFKWNLTGKEQNLSRERDGLKGSFWTVKLSVRSKHCKCREGDFLPPFVLVRKKKQKKQQYEDLQSRPDASAELTVETIRDAHMRQSKPKIYVQVSDPVGQRFASVFLVNASKQPPTPHPPTRSNCALNKKQLLALSHSAASCRLSRSRSSRSPRQQKVGCRRCHLAKKQNCWSTNILIGPGLAVLPPLQLVRF